MRATFIKRRIVVAIVIAILGWTTVQTTQVIISFLSKPTFVCEPGEYTWVKGDRMWNVADIRCEGNITDATKQIMDDNGIKGSDLDLLRPGTIIIIKGDK